MGMGIDYGDRDQFWVKMDSDGLGGIVGWDGLVHSTIRWGSIRKVALLSSHQYTNQIAL